LFPEVFVSGRTGFDAVIGNPPFLGGKKISVAFGSPYRENLVRSIAGGRTGNADLIAYMLLRAGQVSGDSGQIGCIATNSVAQGETREVGLRPLMDGGFDLRAGVKSEPWPTQGASLEYSVVWLSRTPRSPGVRAVGDGVLVAGLTASLEPTGVTLGTPFSLKACAGIAFQGCIILGSGFTMKPEEAEEMIRIAPDHTAVLRPYVNGDDLNSAPDCSASRWVVDFGERSESEARRWPLAYAWVEARVKPERVKKDAEKYPRMVYEWWKFWNARPSLRRATSDLGHVMAITRHSKVVMPALVPNGQVISEACVVFATDDFADLALLSSAPHYWWTLAHASSLGAAPRYTPSDVFETLARPVLTGEMRTAGQGLHEERSAFMLERQLGLTKLYNLVHDPAVQNDAEVGRLRELHVAVDSAVFAAYGWTDLEPDHGHHGTRQGVRYTVAPTVQTEILDRLLALNHQRYADEVAAGLHDKGAKRLPRRRTEAVDDLPTLFGGVPTLFGSVPTLFGEDA
jgi:hypothetical protein